MTTAYTFGGEKFSPPPSPFRTNRFSKITEGTKSATSSEKKNYFNSTTAFRAYRQVAKEIQTQARARSADAKRPFSVKKKLSRHDIVNILPPSPETYEPERRSGFRFGQIPRKDIFAHIREEDYADDFEELSLPPGPPVEDNFPPSILKKDSLDEDSLSEYDIDEYRERLKKNRKHVIWSDSDDTNSIAKSKSYQPSKRNSVSNSVNNDEVNSLNNDEESVNNNRDNFAPFFTGDYDPFHLLQKDDSFRAVRPVRRSTIGANLDTHEIINLIGDTGALTRVYSDEPQPKPGKRIKDYRPANQFHPWNIHEDPIILPDFPIENPISRKIRRSTEIISGDTNVFPIPSEKSRRNTEIVGDDVLSRKNKSNRKQSMKTPDVTQEETKEDSEEKELDDDRGNENSTEKDIISDEKKEDFTISTNVDTTEPSKKVNFSLPSSPAASSKRYVPTDTDNQDHSSISRRSYQPRYQISPAPPSQYSSNQPLIQTKIVYVRVGETTKPRPMNLWEYLFPCCCSYNALDQVEPMPNNNTFDQATQTIETLTTMKERDNQLLLCKNSMSTETNEFHFISAKESHTLLVQQQQSFLSPVIEEDNENCESCRLLSSERQILKQMNEKFNHLQSFHRHSKENPSRRNSSFSEKQIFLDDLQQLSKLSKEFEKQLESLKRTYNS